MSEEIIKTEKDAEIFANALLNPPAPNDALIKEQNNYAEKAEENKPVVFWLDGFDGDCVFGFQYPNPLISNFKDLIEKGLTPVGIRYDGTGVIDIVVAKDEGFQSYLEKIKNKQPTGKPLIQL